MTYEELEKLNIDFSDCKINPAAPGPSGKKKKSSDQGKKISNQEQKPKSKAGRKNRVLTKQHYEEYKERQRQTYDMFMHTKSPDNFTIEHVKGEIIDNNDIEQFKDLYQLTCDSILEEFQENNPDLVKKHPYQWFKTLLLQIKKSVPRITADDIEKCFIVWDCISDLLYKIGLYPTFELFQYMTNIYKYQLEDRQGLNSLYIDLLKKINIESKNALITELAACPYNSTNKIFLAKVNGIVEQQEPRQIEIHHDIRNYNNLPMFGSEKN